jgi:hypothetical protein
MVVRNHNNLCQDAKLYYYDCLFGEGCEQIPESVNNHLKHCRKCQKKIEQLKVALSTKKCIKSEAGQNTSAVTTMLELHFAYIGKLVTCETVRPFLPGLLDPTLEIRIPTPITVHLDNCPQCAEDLNKIRELNLPSTQLYCISQFFADRTNQQTTEYSEMAPVIKTMANRADSEITTIYHVDESAKNKQAANSNGLYSGFPINVEILEPKPEVEQPVVSFDFAAALKKKIAAMNLRPLLKVGLAAAAVIMIGIFLLSDTKSLEAESVEEMYKAIQGVENVYIVSFNADMTGRLQERWISHTLNISMIKNKKEVALANIKTGREKTKNLDTGVIERRKIPEDILINAKQEMAGCLGLTPFNKISDLPPDSQWRLVDDQSQATEGIKVYDLDCAEQTSRYLYKLRCYVDSETFPEKIQVFRTLKGQSEFELITVYKIHSIKESEIKKIIRDEGLSNY